MFKNSDELLKHLTGLRKKEEESGAKMFLGFPDRWFQGSDPLYRCRNDHVTKCRLKSEALGSYLCLECYEPAFITFPEDEDGPLSR